ncbi:MAG TPA: IclR family transcriptional regulator [Acidobacteriota bacterium]|jgi:DNA-binding IclR family transcriptional regulator
MANGVQSLDRALRILEVLASSDRGLGISEVSRRVKLPASTSHRLLSTLSHRGFVTQLGDETYQLGHKVVEMGQTYLEASQLCRTVRPFLENVGGRTGESAFLVVADRGEAFYVDKVESPRMLRVFSRIGHRAPLYCTASGKILLSGYADDQLKRYLKQTRLIRLTRNTITSAAALRAEVQNIRHRGYAYDLEECEGGARCIAVPLCGFNGRVLAALSVSGPSSRLSRKKMEEVAGFLTGVGKQISAQLGCSIA